MIIAIPIDEKNLEAKVGSSFGRSQEYLIYNSDSNKETYLVNPAATSPGGAGIKASQFLVDQKVDVVITPRCGQNAADVLIEGNVQLFESDDVSIKENLERFSNGKLKALNDIHEGYHKH